MRMSRKVAFVAFTAFILLLSSFFSTTDSREITFLALYPEKIESVRNMFMKRAKNDVYLDYTGSGVYPESLISNIERAILNENILEWQPRSKFYQNRVNSVKKELLAFLGTNLDEYQVVFLPSATHAYKRLAESFPWSEKARFLYTTYNHNSIIGIRKIATSYNASWECIGHYDSLFDLDPRDQRMNLVAFPLEDNYGGTKPSNAVLKSLFTRNLSNYFFVADAAAYLSTNELNLTEFPFHAIGLSFYKLFGIPNVGALIIRKDFSQILSMKTFSTYSKHYTIEDDPISMEDSISIKEGLSFFDEIGMKNINAHTWNMTKRLYDGLNSLKHMNGGKLAVVYGNHDQNNPEIQGGIVSFNLMKPEGSFYGYASVVDMAGEAGFHLRGGCHCNPGFCFESVGIEEGVVKAYYDRKTTCGDKFDIVDGIPLGSVRASVGWATTKKDVDSFLSWLEVTFCM